MKREHHQAPDVSLQYLRGLLHYHERMLLGQKCPDVNGCHNQDLCGGECPALLFTDSYSAALKEAIRCIEIVHAEELKDGSAEKSPKKKPKEKRNHFRENGKLYGKLALLFLFGYFVGSLVFKLLEFLF